ncbi:pectate lyase [Ahniella affigens]|uniref:Pectate lyase n=1 Tax=Ahniella affigens TaxID=2021234 RepID=A0A2P1PTU8_9GAMM|nr:pectate lyase [Ahniella affigens]AVP98267.1 pectate lyase [Ahniella affigens]
MSEMPLNPISQRRSHQHVSTPAADPVRRLERWLVLIAAALAIWGLMPRVEAAERAFPGAVGWAAETPGGRGGQVLRVTTLATDGPGSFKEALNTKGPRIIVFEVAGVIDLRLAEWAITEPFLTIAGQTAPPPGITLIKGGLTIATHDVVIRHLHIRPGEGGLKKHAGVDFDAITTVAGAKDVIIDHNSLTWASDENLSASGARFIGDGPDAWREFVSHRITFSHNLLAEGLAHSIHAKGEHSKGSLIHDNVTDIVIIGNLYAHNYERSPLFKGGTRGQVINNLIYDPGQRAIHYNLIAEEWYGHEYLTGQISVRGNVLRAGPSTEPLALFMFGGSGDLELFLDDNLAFDRIGRDLPQLGRYNAGRAKLIDLKVAPKLPPGVRVMSAREVEDWVVAEAGARPWDRDDIDRRIVANVMEGRGHIIDDEAAVGGYPVIAEVRAPFVPEDWDLGTMEPKKPLPRRPPPK